MESFEGRFQAALVDRLQKTIADEIDAVITGRLKFDEYIAKCAVIRTLQDMLAEMSDIRAALAREATGGQQPSPVMQKFRR